VLKTLKDIKIILIIILVFFVSGVFAGYSIKKTKEVEKVIRVEPVVKVVTKNIEVPVWRTKYITRVKTVTVNKTIVKKVKEIVVTTENAIEVANKYQEEILKFESTDIEIKMEPWIINNGVPQEEIDMSAKLRYLSWDLKVKNNFKILNDAKGNEAEDTPLMIGFNYVLDRNNVELTMCKEFIKIPFVDIPLTLGLSYTLH
jgi:hypothetical protein